jgi:hypothetical protein
MSDELRILAAVSISILLFICIICGWQYKKTVAFITHGYEQVSIVGVSCVVWQKIKENPAESD